MASHSQALRFALLAFGFAGCTVVTKVDWTQIPRAETGGGGSSVGGASTVEGGAPTVEGGAPTVEGGAPTVEGPSGPEGGSAGEAL